MVGFGKIEQQTPQIIKRKISDNILILSHNTRISILSFDEKIYFDFLKRYQDIRANKLK